MVLLGGTLALIVSLAEYAIAGAAKPPPFLIGAIEETGKVVALFLIVRDRRYHWTLNGLLLGGAVGVGFAGFETAGYALSALATNNAGAFFVTLIERAILAPGAHASWAAMNGAALWRVKGDRPFSIAMLFDIRFLRVFLFTVVLHSVWDMPAVASVPFALGELGLTTIGVVGVLAFVQDGINQVRAAQAAATQGAAVATA
jgi:RsiW-degrading membrane proteinase PrsW (M82 family)